MSDSISNLKERFDNYHKYNKMRYERFREILPLAKRSAFDTICYLLHTNIPNLPGYLKPEKEVPPPYGIYKLNYLPDDIIKNLSKPFPKQDIDKKRLKESWPKTAHIKSLFLMGSLGSVAQTDDSDMDFWVCIHSKTTSQRQKDLLRSKLNSIEKWALEKASIEAHFFICDVDDIKQNYFGNLDDENAGSSQGKILKEEFLRTSILVAGKVPFWWLVPPETNDIEYLVIKKMVEASTEMKKSDLIDLGNLYELNLQESFGASLWQLGKAMESPFKSVLKMGLLEAYMDPDFKVPLLCNELKKRVHMIKTDIPPTEEYFDPYTIMFEKVLEYYSSRKEPHIIKLLKSCFFLKSTSGDLLKNENNFKEKILKKYHQIWGNDNINLAELKNYKEWNFNKLNELGGEIHQFLLNSYKRLSHTIKSNSHVKQSITENDLTVIGRKLSSFYAEKEFKIPFEKRVFANALWQESVTIYPYNCNTSAQSWRIYQGQHPKVQSQLKSIEDKLLAEKNSLISLIIWAVQNKVIDRSTSIYLAPSPSFLKMQDLHEILDLVFHLLPSKNISHIQNNCLLESEKLLSLLVATNLSNTRTDPEVKKVEICYFNSWGERFFRTCILRDLSPIMNNLKSKLQENPEHFINTKTKIYAPRGPHQKALICSVQEVIEKSLS